MRSIPTRTLSPLPLVAALSIGLYPALAPAQGERSLRVEQPVYSGASHARGVIPVQSSSHLAPTPDATCTVTYQAGPVISQVDIVLVYWTAIDSTVSSWAPGFMTAIPNSTYFDWLQEYDTPSSGGTDQTICRGGYSGTAVTITPTTVTSTTVDDSQIGPELASQITNGHLPAPKLDSTGRPNTLYFIFFPAAYTITLQGSSSCVQFCGYHSDGQYNSSYFPYAVIPYVNPTGPCGSGCGSGTYSQVLGGISSHELMEATTDTDVGDNNVGWYANGGSCGEVGDLCDTGSGDTATVDGYTVQLIWSQKQKKCVSSGTGYTACGGPLDSDAGTSDHDAGSGADAGHGGHDAGTHDASVGDDSGTSDDGGTVTSDDSGSTTTSDDSGSVALADSGSPATPDDGGSATPISDGSAGAGGEGSESNPSSGCSCRAAGASDSKTPSALLGLGALALAVGAGVRRKKRA